MKIETFEGVRKLIKSESLKDYVYESTANFENYVTSIRPKLLEGITDEKWVLDTINNFLGGSIDCLSGGGAVIDYLDKVKHHCLYLGPFAEAKSRVIEMLKKEELNNLGYAWVERKPRSSE